MISRTLTRWKSLLDPVIAASQPTILEGIHLTNGVTVINHKLAQIQQGWIITDITGAATIYRSAPFNDKTLTLTSNAAVTVNIEVF